MFFSCFGTVCQEHTDRPLFSFPLTSWPESCCCDGDMDVTKPFPSRGAHGNLEGDTAHWRQRTQHHMNLGDASLKQPPPRETNYNRASAIHSITKAWSVPSIVWKCCSGATQNRFCLSSSQLNLTHGASKTTIDSLMPLRTCTGMAKQQHTGKWPAICKEPDTI